MPIYEYKCPKCSKVFEKFWKVYGLVPDGTNCPECNTPSPKVFSTCNFQFSLYLRELGEGNMVNY